MTAFVEMAQWIQDVVAADPGRFTLRELQLANKILLASIEAPWGPEPEDPIPYDSLTPFEKLKRWFLLVCEVPSRLRPREKAEAQQILTEMALSPAGQGGPHDVRSFVKPSNN